MNHAQRKKYQYARYQELYNKCPKKLAEFIANSDLSFLEKKEILPDGKDVQEVYENVWGQVGPYYIKFKERQAPIISIKDLVPSFKVREIKARIAGTKSGSTSGLDGIERAHVNKVGVGELLELLYDIVVREGIYPSS